MPDLVDTLHGYLAEASLLRGESLVPNSGAAPIELQDHLLDVRRRLDRVEHLLATVVRLTARAERAATALKHEAADDWDEAALKTLSAPVRRGDEYTSAKERAAQANLATITAQRRAREATEAVSHCKEAETVLRLTHNGLNDTRHDTLALLRLLTFESHLER